MIFVSDATSRRWCARCCHTTRPVFPSTRIAVSPRSVGEKVCETSAPPVSRRSGVTFATFATTGPLTAAAGFGETCGTGATIG